MSLKVRGVLVLVIGTILGLTVSIGSSMLAEREAHRAALAATEQPGEYMALP